MKPLIDQETLEARFEEHAAMAELWVSRVNASRNLKLVVDKTALLLAIKSAYDDVERYKLYHQEKPEIQKSNSVKRVAYLTKWLLKTRPIVRDGTEITQQIDHILCNAAFCLVIVRAHISGELGKDFVFCVDKEWEMIYDLTFREINGDGLLAIFQIVFDAVRAQPFIQDL